MSPAYCVVTIQTASIGGKLQMVLKKRIPSHNTQNTGLFISPAGISELDCATTKTDTAERSISIGRESLKVFFCTRDLGVLPGSTARGSREEKWRSQ